ncbi:MAG: hypothetical protein PHN75_02325 [Syntrophales bacterium]|nr:hypothetical protein [Syntrophales bacterium]
MFGKDSCKTPKTYHPWTGKRRRTILFYFILGVIIMAGLSVTNYLTDDVRQDIIMDGDAALQSISVYLTGEFNELERTGDVLSGLPWVVAALESGTTEDITQADDNLLHFNKEMETAVCYILDRNGKVIASSNFRDNDSFVGHTYNFRKYFTQAIRGVPSKDFALGVTSSKKGFYVGSPVRDSYNRVIGVAVVKQNVEEMERYLRGYPMCFLINRLGIVLLSTKPEYSLKGLWPIDQKVEQELIAARQFGQKHFESVFNHEITNGMEVKMQETPYLVTREFLSQDGWSIVFLTKMQKVKAYEIGGIVVTFTLVSVFLLIYLIATKWTKTTEELARLHGRVNNLD